MNRKLTISLLVLWSFSSMVLSAQRRDDGVEVKIDDLQATPVGVSITLRSADSRETLQMMIGFPEGQSIARAIRKEKTERPMSHDLFKAFLDRNGWHVQKVFIKDLKEGTFIADLTLEGKDHETQVYDARPSDAMAIGLRYGAKIFVNRQVFEQQKKGEDQEQEQEDLRSKPKQLRL
ncbi:MAG: bifunctional nuclease family protein [Acidobacteria bacterium]|nr:bifunctional nuclease family protein [Acidobacteriota bacterium]